MTCFRATVTALTLLFAVWPPPVAAQSLADAARQAAAAREKNKAAPTKVLTAGDLKASDRDLVAAAIREKMLADAPAPAVDAEPVAAPALQPPPSTFSTEGFTTEQQWRNKRAELQSTLDRDRLFVISMQTRIDGLASSLSRVQFRAEELILERQRQEALTELSRLRAAAASSAVAITTFEEQARRAGIPAGWLRP